jgi:Ca2+-binding RTX toxin-like protein
MVAALVVWHPLPAFADIQEDVTRDHDSDWHMRHTSCTAVTGTGSQSFEVGPLGLPGDVPDNSPSPPAGTGSLELRIGANGDSLEENRNTRFAGKLLTELEQLTYWTYVASVPVSGFAPAPHVGLSLDTDGNGSFDDTLIFEPSFQQLSDGDGQHDVVATTWQHWIAYDEGSTLPEGLWYLRTQGPTTLKRIEDWRAQFPAARIVNPQNLGGVFVAAGCGAPTWTGFDGNTDAFRIRFTGDSDNRLFDFDPANPTEATRLNCSPETNVNPTGTAHSINCTATQATGLPVPGVNIQAEATGVNDPDAVDGYSPTSPDFGCETDEEGTCQFTHGPTGTVSVGTTTYRVWIDIDDNSATTEADPDEGRNESTTPGGRPEVDDTDVLEKTWAASRLDCEPESETKPAGTPHTITCTARDSSNNLITGVEIDVEATGVNDPDGSNSNSQGSPDFTCITGSNGSCVVTHGPGTGGRGTTTTAGRTTYRAWIDGDGSNSTQEADSTEGVSTSGSIPEIDGTDVVEANFTSTGTTPTPTPGVTSSPSASPSVSGSPSPTPSGSGSPSPSPSPSPTPPVRDCSAPAGVNVISGTPGNDRIVGTGGVDFICGFGGNDQIDGRGGNDVIRGGRGSDTIFGGAGSDSLIGGAGDDEIAGERGRDELSGRGGNDLLAGGRGHDELLGGPGRDRLDGGRGTDRCSGGRGRDTTRRCE